MITAQDIERIKNLPQDKMVLMAVVNTNPAVQDNLGAALITRIKSHAKDEALPPTLLERLLEDLSGARREFGKSAVYVMGEDLDERFDVQLDLPERLHYGRPLRSILMSAAELYPRAGVLLLDRETARLFVLEQGELSEVLRQSNPDVDDRNDAETTGRRGVAGAGNSVSDGPQSSSGNDFFQNYLDASEQRFFNGISAELETVMRERGLEYLVLVGPDARRASFKAEIPPTARFEVIGETNVEVGAGAAPLKSLQEKVQPMVEAFREVLEERLLSEVQEKGIMVMESVLEAVQQGRVYALLVPEDGSQIHIYAGNDPGVPYFTARKDLTESPLDGSVMARVTLEDALPALVENYGVEVRRLHGAHAERLVREYGGLAALVRY